MVFFIVFFQVLNCIVTQPNTEQQAESRDKILEELSRKRIQSRPPIHGNSPNVTPSTTSIAKQIARTPSRLPISKSRTPKPIHTTALTPHTPVAVRHTPRLHIGEVTSSNDQNARAGQMNIHHTPISQLKQPAAVPSTVIPGPNITVNVNVSNTQPQSPNQNTQTIRKNDQNIENAINGGDSGGDRRNNSNESLLTDDSDSMGNEANLSDSRCETPKSDTRNISACRRLFPQNEAEQTRRSATFNKIDNLTHTIDNMTRTIPGDTTTHSSNNQFRTRSKNSFSNTSAKSPNAPNSQTFTKPKISLQNATYDVSAENLSVRPSIEQRAYNGIDSEEFIAQSTSEGTNNGSTFGNMVDIPSEALLGSINVSDDEMNVDDANHQNENVKKRSRSGSKVTDKRSLPKDSYDLSNPQRQPSVILHRDTTRPGTPQINRQSNANVSNVRGSISYNILPPVTFQDSEIIEERSPNSQKIVSKVNKVVNSLSIINAILIGTNF